MFFFLLLALLLLIVYWYFRAKGLSVSSYTEGSGPRFLSSAERMAVNKRVRSLLRKHKEGVGYQNFGGYCSNCKVKLRKGVHGQCSKCYSLMLSIERDVKDAMLSVDHSYYKEKKRR